MAEMKGKSREEIIREDVKTLHGLGYAQQLFREMGGFSNFAISFSIISILTGAIILYGYGLKFAGPIINTVGWPLVSLVTLTVAASMAELASMYPTAGGLYYWAYRLGGKTWAWVTAWLNMLGQITITAGINMAAAIYITGMFVFLFNVPGDTTVPLLGAVNGWNFWLFVMVLIMIPQVLINVMGIKLTALLNDFSVYWHIGGVIVMALLLTIFGKYHNSLEFMFSTTQTVSPADVSGSFFVGPLEVQSIMLRIIPGLSNLYGAGIFAFAFVLALLQAQWTYTGYDASAHMAEETYLAKMNSAWGVFLSVAVSAVVGYVSLLALTNSIPPDKIADTASAAYPVLFIAQNALQPFFANLIAIIIAVAMWLCGLSSITSMARMWFAFARDEGMPGSGFLKRVSHRWRTPANSIVVTSIIAVLITVYSAAFSVIVSMSTTALYLAYAIPVYLNWRNKRRGQGEFTTKETAPWNLGQWGPLINIICFTWVAFITVLFSIPPNELAGWTMIALGVLLVIYWQVSEKRRFTGPRKATEEELAAVEKEFM
jgi:amino acid transporter